MDIKTLSNSIVDFLEVAKDAANASFIMERDYQRIQSLESKVKKNESEISVLKSEISVLKSDLSDLKKRKILDYYRLHVARTNQKAFDEYLKTREGKCNYFLFKLSSVCLSSFSTARTER